MPFPSAETNLLFSPMLETTIGFAAAIDSKSLLGMVSTLFGSVALYMASSTSAAASYAGTFAGSISPPKMTLSAAPSFAASDLRSPSKGP